MDIFEQISNEKFFNPLTGKNKKIYFECISELIDFSKKNMTMYESDVKSTLAMFLANRKYHVQDDDTVFKFNESDASRILRKFRECGWMTPPEFGNNGMYVTHITYNCSQIIGFLQEINHRKNTATLSNRILSMYGLLHGIFDENSADVAVQAKRNRPYETVVQPLLDDQKKLSDDLWSLREDAPHILDALQEITELADFGKFLNHDEIVKKFFHDFYILKQKGIGPALLRDIKHGLKQFPDSPLFERAVREYANSKQISDTESRAKLLEDIRNMVSYFEYDYPVMMQAIDDSIFKYCRLENVKIHMLLSENTDTRDDIAMMFSYLKDATDDKRNLLIEQLKKCITIESQEYISRLSYQKKKRQALSTESAAIETTEITETDKRQWLNRLKTQSSNPYSLNETNRFFHELSDSNIPLSASAESIKTKHDALMYISAFIHAKSPDFGYTVSAYPDSVKTAVGEIQNINIERKQD